MNTKDIVLPGNVSQDCTLSLILDYLHHAPPSTHAFCAYSLKELFNISVQNNKIQIKIQVNNFIQIDFFHITIQYSTTKFILSLFSFLTSICMSGFQSELCGFSYRIHHYSNQEQITKCEGFSVSLFFLFLGFFYLLS